MASSRRSTRPPHPAWSGRTASAASDATSTAAEVERPLSMADTKPELVDAAVAAGLDQAEAKAMTKAELLGWLDAS